MKFKKLIAMALAFAMALTLAVPAFAEDETVVTDEPIIEAAELTKSVPATISVDEGKEQIVPAAEVVNALPAAAKPSSDKIPLNPNDQAGTDYDYSKEYDGKGWSTWKNVIFLGNASPNSTDAEVSGWHLVASKGDSAVTEMHVEFVDTSGNLLYTLGERGVPTPSTPGNAPRTNGWIVVAPKGWKIDVAKSYIVTPAGGPFNISGCYLAGTPKPGDPTEPQPINAELKIQKLIEGTSGNVAPTYESFTFQVLDGTTVLGTVTTSKTTGLGNATVTVTPGKTYTIHEVLEGYQTGKYTATDMTVTIPADATEDYTETVSFINTPNGETSRAFCR